MKCLNTLLLKIYDSKTFKIFVIVIISLMTIYLFIKISYLVDKYQSTRDGYYWFLSAASQCIATIFAFIFAGYSIVLSIMNNNENKNEELKELYDEIKKNYYNSLRIITIIAGAAIITNLMMILFNDKTSSLKYYGITLSILLNLITIILTIIFVVSIIDPNKYHNAAVKIIKNEITELEKDNLDVTSSEFFTEFIKLEKIIRDYFKKHKINIQIKNQMSFPSLKNMIESLFNNEKISKEDYDILINLNRYRNLVFHGHVDKVNKHALNTTEKYILKFNKLK